jgi:hypothetical protein
VRDLLRFLEPSPELDSGAALAEDGCAICDRSPCHSASHDCRAPQEIREFEATPDDEEYYLQEMIFGRYARKLLMQQQLKKLLAFARIVNHDLRSWLLRERHFLFSLSLSLSLCLCLSLSPLSAVRLTAIRKRAARIEDLAGALEMLHAQFDLPFLDAIPAVPTSDDLPRGARTFPKLVPRLRRGVTYLRSGLHAGHLHASASQRSR